MEERLIVKNFGPLKDVDIPLKDVMVFIGPQGSGKSTIAKLLAGIHDQELNEKTESFLNVIGDYSINWLTDKTTIQFSKPQRAILYNNSEYQPMGYGFRFNREEWEDQIKFLSVLKIDINENIQRLEDISNYNPSIYFNNLKAHIADIINHIKYRPFDYFINKQLIVTTDFLKQPFGGERNIDEDVDFIINWVENTDYQEGMNFKELLGQITSRIDTIISVLKNIIQTNVCYIPADRISLPTTAGYFFTLNKHKIPISKSITSFGVAFETARNEISNYYDDILNVRYVYGNGDRIFFNESQSISFSEASSGIQALLPLRIVIEAISKENNPQGNLFIIEEPELNLYPSAQKKLVDFLVRKCTKGNNKLIITTHSPYILTALNNHIEAAEAAKNEKVSSEEVEKIMPKESWLDFDRVGAWYVDKGTCRDIMSKEEKLIAGENIDDVSSQIMDEFQELVHLKYRE